MKQLYLLLFSLLLSTLTPCSAQDTLSFGGIYDLPGAEVRAAYVPVSPLAQNFTIEEVYRLPGTFYDPARLVALLPGVVQTNDQANHLSVRGNSPNANLWRLNGLAIVNPNHTANAGTFYDFPTLSGGGVNAISAQMLDNSGFLAGGLPVEYGYATGGTFDLRLRPGSKARRKYQAQAGFIGFDLMAEGPIGNSGQTSYLVNGRYSFTGLLADMGVDFGGEEIRFADLNAHLHHQWEGGEISTFAIVGGSSNVFSFTDEDGEGVTEQKELFDIDFDSQLQVYGMNLSSQLGSGRIKAGLAFSKTNTGRLQQLRDQDPSLNQELINNKINGNLSYALALGKGELTAGAEILLQDADLETFISTAPSSVFSFTTSASLFASSPFLGYRFTSKRSSLNLGLRASSYGRDFDELSFEPRFSYELRTNAGRFLVNAERISTPPVAALLVEANFDPLSPDDNNFIPVSNNFELGYGNSFGGITAMLKGYFQFTNKDYGLEEDGFIRSANNLLELYAFNGGLSFPTVATRRYGMELDLAGGRKTKGWYYRGNLSLLRAETEQADGSWTKDRFSVDYIAKVTVGREWNGQDRKERDRTYGFNLALIANGGERYGVVDAPQAGSTFIRQYFHRQNLSGGYINQVQGYFRPDLRLYKTKIRPKTTTTLALDVQNVANVENLGNVYYDVFLDQPNERFQLGLIPVLSYRVVWR